MQYADILDLDTLYLRAGDGRQIEIAVRVAPLELAGERYEIDGVSVRVRLDVSRTVTGYALRLRFAAPVSGACMRCLGEASPVFEVDAREVEQPGESEELHSPYLEGASLDLATWARDALMLALPVQILCQDDCRGLCPVCGENLNRADPAEHRHERAGSSPWDKLKQLKND